VTPNTHERGTSLLRAVIFDMDGVIVDSHPTHRQAWHMFLQALGREVSASELDFILEGRTRGEILRHFLGDLSEEQVRNYGKRKDEFLQQAVLEVKTVPGVVAFLESLKAVGVVAAVATSASATRAFSTLEHLRLIDLFSVIITGNDVVRGKPDPAIYRLTCQRLKIAPRNALAIEDAVSGIQAARRAGVKCIGVAGCQPAEKLRQAGAGQVIENFLGISPTTLEVLLRSNGERLSPGQSFSVTA
jgi:beta-phosphoglucomutase